MKKINNYSAQFKVIQKPENENNNYYIHKQSSFGNNKKKRNYQNKTKNS